MENVELILEGLNSANIDSILSKSIEIRQLKKQIEKYDDMLKDKLKAFLKERHWDRYVNKETKVSVSLITQERKTPDMRQLEMMLSKEEMIHAFKTTTFEKISIITPEDRERLKKHVKRK